MRVTLFSDLHLHPNLAPTLRNWDHCLAIVEREHPDFVIVGGDVVLDDPDLSDNQRFARGQLERIGAPWLLVPGNHDLGDSIEAPYEGQPVTQARLDAYRALHGADRWSVDVVAGWRLVGINAMLPGSGLASDAEQQEWLVERLRGSPLPIAVFLHKPLWIDTPDEPPRGTMALWPRPRRSLMHAMRGADVRHVISGHLHCHRRLAGEQFDMTWAPTTCLVTRADVVGTPRSTGWLQLDLCPERIDCTLRVSAALAPLDITDAIAAHGAMRHVPVATLSRLA